MGLEKGYVEIGCFGISKKNQHVTTMAPKPSTTTSTPVDSFCPFEFYDLYDGKVRNPCTLLSCQSENAQNNEVCVESVRIYCERSELEKGYVEVGCFGIGKNEQITTSPSPWTCPYKYNDLANAPNPCDLKSCKDNYESDSCKQAVYTYCSISEKVHNDVELGCLSVRSPKTATTTTTTTSAPKPMCPFKYYDLSDAINPCDVESCKINNEGEICHEAVAIYCKRSKEEKGETEFGCMGVEKIPVAVVTTTTPQPSEICPYKYTNLIAKNPCSLDVCQITTDNVECRDGIELYCKQSKHDHNDVIEKGCVVILAKSATTTTTKKPSIVHTTTAAPKFITTAIPFVRQTTTNEYEISITTNSVQIPVITTIRPVHTTMPPTIVTTTTPHVPERPFCPFKYFDLNYAKNPCQLQVCQNN